MFCVAGFRPGSRGHVVVARGPKPIDALSGLPFLIWSSAKIVVMNSLSLLAKWQEPTMESSVRTNDISNRKH